MMLFHEYLLEASHDDQVILKTMDGAYTRRELNDFSDQAARQLTAQGFVTGDCIVLLMQNGLDALVMQLACSKAGCVFVPVSPQEPAVRINRIIEAVGPSLVVTAGDNTFQTTVTQGKMISGALVLEETAAAAAASGAVQVNENNLIYIIYSSGTTGNPKGICMSHRAVVSFFRASVAHCGLKAMDNLGTISPLQFDFSILDLGVAYGSGACLTIVPQALAYKPAKLIGFLKDKGVTQFDSVPSVWSMVILYTPHLLEEIGFLKAIMFAGEKFPTDNLRLIQEKSPTLKVINCFGQSESIACAFHDLPNPLPEDTQELSFGPGFPGNTFYIVDEASAQITEPRTIGELWVSNQCLFDGYWKNPQLTAERLVKDPFRPETDYMLFKTGDLVYKDEEGNFYFAGRKDNQVKVKGNRVELDEIDQCLEKHENVREALTVFYDDGTSKKLIAFVSGKADIVATGEEIRRHCRLNLPSYMVPEEVIVRDRLPTTINGKIDKKQLLAEHEQNQKVLS